MIKVYKFHILFDDWSKLTEFFIKHQLNQSFMRNEKLNLYIHLYGWTTNKKIKDIFQSQRSDIFILSKSLINEDDFDTFRSEFIQSELQLRPYKKYNNKTGKYEYVDIASTKSEHIAITEYLMESFGEIASKVCVSSYYHLKDEYIDVLDILLYTSYHDIYHAENEAIEETSFINSTYDLTPRGNNISSIAESIDEFGVFVVIYSDLFK